MATKRPAPSLEHVVKKLKPDEEITNEAPVEAVAASSTTDSLPTNSATPNDVVMKTESLELVR